MQPTATAVASLTPSPSSSSLSWSSQSAAVAGGAADAGGAAADSCFRAPAGENPATPTAPCAVAGAAAGVPLAESAGLHAAAVRGAD